MAAFSEVQAITPEQAHSLRHVVLRAHQPREAAILAEDQLATAGHYGIYMAETLIATASVYPSIPPGNCDGPAWRIRMMAVDPAHRRQGLGHLVMNACEEHAQRHGATMIWCNARVHALPFYEAAGYKTLSEPFDIPGIGLHYRLLKKLP